MLGIESQRFTGLYLQPDRLSVFDLANLSLTIEECSHQFVRDQPDILQACKCV